MPIRSWLLLAALASLSVSARAQVGSLQRHLVLKPGSGGFSGPVDEFDELGASLAALGDLDGNGVGDLAVGAPRDDDGGRDRGAVWILRLAADGTVVGEQKISQLVGGFSGALADRAQLGRAVAGVGDLDGDGVGELAVLSQRPNRLWILFLNPDGTVRTLRENLFTDPVLVPAPLEASFHGGDLVALGDLDGDGLGDLAVGSPRDPDGATNAGAVWIVRLAADGSLAGAHKISQLHGGFAGTLGADSYFGTAIVHLGDLNGDGQRELGVLSPGSVFGGEMWILNLDAAEQVSSWNVHDLRVYGLSWPAPNGSQVSGCSRSYAWLGDLDGDGLGELAMGFPYANWPGTTSDAGIRVSRVRADGRIVKGTRIGDGRGGLTSLPQGNDFGTALAALGDLDGDGAPELAVGASTERSAGLTTGGVWILSLDPDAARNGSGMNPTILSQSAEPVYGTPWTATLDCSGHAPGLAAVFGFSEPRAGIFASAGEVLVGGTPLFVLMGPHASGPTQLSGLVPPFSVSLLDLPFFVQGYCTGAPGPRLSNALDVILGL